MTGKGHVIRPSETELKTFCGRPVFYGLTASSLSRYRGHEHLRGWCRSCTRAIRHDSHSLQVPSSTVVD